MRTVGWWMVGLACLLGSSPAAARVHSVHIAVTKCRESGVATEPAAWAIEPAPAAAATLALVRPLLSDPQGDIDEYLSGQALQSPTRKSTLACLQRLAAEVDREDRVIVYVATAAIRLEGRRWWLLTDDAVVVRADDSQARRTEGAISLSELGQTLRKLTASRVLVVLDLCSTDAPATHEELKAAFGDSPGRCVIAWSTGRKGYWEAGGRITCLAGWLADGLRGAADRDASGQVTQAELVEYLRARSARPPSGGDPGRLVVLGRDLAWEHALRSAPLGVAVERLATAIGELLQGKAPVRVVEPTLKNGKTVNAPYAKIIAQRVQAALAKRGIATTDDAADAAVVLHGRVEARGTPERLILQWEAMSGGKSLGMVRDTLLTTPGLANLTLPTARQVTSDGSLPGARGAEIEVIEEGPPPRHPHFAGYEGLPIALHFDASDHSGRNVREIRPVEVGGDCYLPVEQGLCLRIWVFRRSETPCAILVLVDGANVRSLAGLPEAARFGTPEEHLANLTYSILDEKRDYSFAEWTTLAARGKAGTATMRKLVVTSAPNALGYRQPGAELGEIRVLVYAARKSTAGERSAAEKWVGMGVGEGSTAPVAVADWRADTELPHARLVYKYRVPNAIPPSPKAR
jgi:hypothetical protein